MATGSRKICERCDALVLELATARVRIAEIEASRAKLEGELAAIRLLLAETVKESELQKADLERLRKSAADSAPHHPERAPREQLQLALERVLQAVADDEAANDPHGSEPGVARTSDDGDLAPAPPARRPPPRARHGRRRLDLTSLPVLEIVAGDGVAPDGCIRIGDEISERIALRRAGYFRLRIVRPKFLPIAYEAVVEADSMVPSDTREDGQIPPDPERPPVVQVAPLPEGVWPRVMADPSAVANVILSKYSDCLPLNRQETISARDGFRIPRSTQCGWLGAAYPLCHRIEQAAFEDALRNAPYIATDATSAPVRGRGKCARWHVFVFVAGQDHVLFRYHQEHNSDVIRALLQGYRGPLVSDAASIYDSLHRTGEIVESACWMHCRRYWYKAIGSDSTRAFEALAVIGKLFEADRHCRELGLDLAAFTRERAARAEPIRTLFDRWVGIYRSSADPRGPLAAAFTYYDNQHDALWRFLENGRLPIDNGASERALRNLVLGNANWTFFANETGLKWYTTFRSLIASCALHRLHPQVYLEEVLRIAPHWSQLRMLDLTPKHWRQTRAQLDSRFRSIITRPWETELADIDLDGAHAPADPAHAPADPAHAPAVAGAEVPRAVAVAK